MLSGVKEYWIVDIKNKSVYVYGFVDYSVDVMKSYSTNDIACSFSFDA